MDIKRSERRQIENEVVFRQANEQVLGELHEMEVNAKETGISPDIYELPIHFYCECSDENCQKRIVIKLNLYNDLHNNRKQFLIKPGHEVLAIERIVLTTPNYAVVEKFVTPPETVPKLQTTDIENV